MRAFAAFQSQDLQVQGLQKPTKHFHAMQQCYIEWHCLSHVWPLSQANQADAQKDRVLLFCRRGSADRWWTPYIYLGQLGQPKVDWAAGGNGIFEWQLQVSLPSLCLLFISSRLLVGVCPEKGSNTVAKLFCPPQTPCQHVTLLAIQDGRQMYHFDWQVILIILGSILTIINMNCLYAAHLEKKQFRSNEVIVSWGRSEAQGVLGVTWLRTSYNHTRIIDWGKGSTHAMRGKYPSNGSWIMGCNYGC